MDWKTLKNTMIPYIAKMDPYLDKAKEYGKRAAELAEEQVQMTPLFVRDQAEYDALLGEKRLVIIAYNETQSVAPDIRLLSSLWLTRAFMDTARLRFISLTESADLAHNLGLTSPLDMRVRYEGEETLHLTGIADIKQWWQAPVYKKIESKNQAPIDPLQAL